MLFLIASEHNTFFTFFTPKLSPIITDSTTKTIIIEEKIPEASIPIQSIPL